jgi:hypothetical protein
MRRPRSRASRPTGEDGVRLGNKAAEEAAGRQAQCRGDQLGLPVNNPLTKPIW